MARKLFGALLLATLVVIAQRADASLFGLPKSLKTSPLAGLEMSLPIWGPSARSFDCILHLSVCQRDSREAAFEPAQVRRVQFRPVESLPDQAQPKPVAMYGLPKALRGQLDRVPQDAPALAPMAHAMFCLQYPKECEVRKIAFRGGRLDLTAERFAELSEVNARVNRGIRPERNTQGLGGEKWLISPASGDCNDYAVTKRHELLERGWPSRALLLAEVVTRAGEHHLVVVARTKQGDFVLDNMSGAIRPWTQAPYRWVRIQSAANPKYWSTVRMTARAA